MSFTIGTNVSPPPESLELPDKLYLLLFRSILGNRTAHVVRADRSRTPVRTRSPIQLVLADEQPTQPPIVTGPVLSVVSYIPFVRMGFRHRFVSVTDKQTKHKPERQPRSLKYV